MRKKKQIKPTAIHKVLTADQDFKQLTENVDFMMDDGNGRAVFMQGVSAHGDSIRRQEKNYR
eukprot:UN09812